MPWARLVSNRRPLACEAARLNVSLRGQKPHQQAVCASMGGRGPLRSDCPWITHDYLGFGQRGPFLPIGGWARDPTFRQADGGAVETPEPPSIDGPRRHPGRLGKIGPGCSTFLWSLWVG
jgi:hypothetical protein